jgi:uncharacterized protein
MQQGGFLSELFYEDRLQALPRLEVQNILADGRVNGAGLRYLAVGHETVQNLGGGQSR